MLHRFLISQPRVTLNGMPTSKSKKVQAPKQSNFMRGHKCFHRILKCHLLGDRIFLPDNPSLVFNIFTIIMVIVSKYSPGGRLFTFIQIYVLTWANYLNRWKTFLKPNKHSCFRNLNYSKDSQNTGKHSSTSQTIDLFSSSEHWQKTTAIQTLHRRFHSTKKLNVVK